MKNLFSAFVLFLSLGVFSLAANASTFTFSPNDKQVDSYSDVFDLDHNYLYLWGIDATVPKKQLNGTTTDLQSALKVGEKIKSATIMIEDIYNWDNKSYALKFFLLDNVKKNDVDSSVDIIAIQDSQSDAPNKEIPFYDDANPYETKRKFQDFTPLVTETQKIPGTPGRRDYDYTYSFNLSQLVTLVNYLGTINTWGNTIYSSTFGIGFDPDCHFYNNGITLTIETQHAPEPATMLLFGTGVAGLAALRRKKSAR